jgi:hypothetical protein
MGESVLVFISHSSEDKETFIEPIVNDLEDAYINVWFDKRKLVPGDNLRKSIFRDGLDKADVALIFFTSKSIQSSWVDKEIKHVLREESKKGNDFDLNKIISIFDSQETYNEISERYPELTDDLLHLMPIDYTKVQLAQLISAIWSKYLSLQGGDVETQRQLLAKDKEIFKKEKEIQELNEKINTLNNQGGSKQQDIEFESIFASGRLSEFISDADCVLSQTYLDPDDIRGSAEACAFGFIEPNKKYQHKINISKKGREFFQWLILNDKKVL